MDPGAIFGFELEVSVEDLAGGVVLKANQSEHRATAFEPVVSAGIGERHHAKTRGGAAERYFRGRRFRAEARLAAPQDTAHGFAADGEVFLVPQLFGEMRIVAALIFAAGQA